MRQVDIIHVTGYSRETGSQHPQKPERDGYMGPGAAYQGVNPGTRQPSRKEGVITPNSSSHEASGIAFGADAGTRCRGYEAPPGHPARLGAADGDRVPAAVIRAGGRDAVTAPIMNKVDADLRWR